MYHDLGFCFESVYVGGGTPTVSPDELVKILELIKSLWPIKQISVETNPNHLTPKTITMLKDAGVNRLSVGVQTFDDDLLAKIGRLQKYGSGREIKEKLSSLLGVFDTLNIDLIFNFPNQTQSLLLRDIEVVEALSVDQVTFYPLMSSNTTKSRLQTQLGRISFQKEKRLYKRIVTELSDTYISASAWCFNRKNSKGMIDEYIVDYKEYAGLGCGSFGYINGTIYSNTFSVQRYIDLLQKNTLPLVASRTFLRSERISYDLLMGLFGGSLNLKEMRSKYGDLVWFCLWKEIIFFAATGAVGFRNGRLSPTPRGRYYLVILMREFFTGVNNLRESCALIDNSS